MTDIPSTTCPSCPVPLSRHTHILLAHGGGGRLMQELIEHVFRPAFGTAAPEWRHDGATLAGPAERMAFTTDSYVVRPLFFPGGDIGDLAVNGTVNDLAMCGARPMWLSTGFIIEEGLPMETLRRVVASMAEAASRAGVRIVTGDTKVVDRGKGDGLYINTAGVGAVVAPTTIAPSAVQPGDAILLNGDIGRHGVAIMAVREGLAFDTEIASDCAPLHAEVLRLFEAGIAVRCLRDCTRGGLAASLIEIARDRNLRLHIDGRAVPVEDAVRGVCEMLGLDPLYVANEGRFIAIVAEADAERARELIGPGAVRIGTVTDEPRGMLTLTSEIGATRVIDLLSGEQLPRIC